MSRLNEVLGSTQLSLLWICAIAAAMVFAALVYSTATFRPETNAGSNRRVLREVLWAVVPIFIVVAAALPAMTGSIPAERNQSFVRESR